VSVECECAHRIVRCVVDSELRRELGPAQADGDGCARAIAYLYLVPAATALARLGCLVMPRRVPFVPIDRCRKWHWHAGPGEIQRVVGVHVSADLHGSLPRGCDFPGPEKIRIRGKPETPRPPKREA